MKADSQIEIKVQEKNLIGIIEWSSLKKDIFRGKGSFSNVYRYVNINNQLETYAVKIIKETEENLLSITQEMQFSKKMMEMPNSKNFFPIFYGYVKYSEKSSEGVKNIYYALIYEEAIGTLEELVLERKKGLSYIENLNLIKSVCFGLLKLQKKGIAHRDIKPSNILYFLENDEIVFKIMDFGEVKIDVNEEGTIRGTPKYFSPETNYVFLNGQEKIKEEYNPYKSDVYSLGLTIIYANLLKIPFGKNEKLAVDSKKNINRNEEKKFNPLNTKSGPYDQFIKECIEEIIKKFKDEKGTNKFKKLLEKSLKYNPKFRYDWKDFKRLARKLIYMKDIEEKNREINYLKNVIEFKDKAINILNDRNSTILKHLCIEIEEKELAERNLNEILKQPPLKSEVQQLEPIKQSEKKFENENNEKKDEKNDEKNNEKNDEKNIQKNIKDNEFFERLLETQYKILFQCQQKDDKEEEKNIEINEPDFEENSRFDVLFLRIDLKIFI